MKRLLCGVLFFLLAAPSWGMENHSDELRDERGRAIGGATVAVYLAGTTTLAALYSDNGITAKANPFQTDTFRGKYNFYAANGVYDIVFSHPLYNFDNSYTRRIALCDPTAGCGGGGGGGGGSPSIGASGAVQAADGVGGFADTGCTGTGGSATCNEFITNGPGIGVWMPTEGAAPGAGTSAGQHKVYIDSTTNRLASHENGGSAKNYVTEGDSQTLTNKLIRRDYTEEVAGCDNGTAGSIWNRPASNAAVASCDAGVNQYSAYMGFNDTTDQSIHRSYRLKSGFAGSIDFRFRYKMSSATSGTVEFCAQLVRLPVGGTPDPAFPSQAAGNCASETVPGTAGLESEVTIPNVTCTSCAAGDRVFVRVSRNADTDSATGDAQLIMAGPIYASVE